MGINRIKLRNLYFRSELIFFYNFLKWIDHEKKQKAGATIPDKNKDKRTKKKSLYSDTIYSGRILFKRSNNYENIKIRS